MIRRDASSCGTNVCFMGATTPTTRDSSDPGSWSPVWDKDPRLHGDGVYEPPTNTHIVPIGGFLLARSGRIPSAHKHTQSADLPARQMLRRQSQNGQFTVGKLSSAKRPLIT